MSLNDNAPVIRLQSYTSDQEEELLHGLTLWAKTRALHDRLRTKRTHRHVAEDAVRSQLARSFQFQFDSEDLEELRGFLIVSNGDARAVANSTSVIEPQQRMHLWLHLCGHLASTGEAKKARLFLQMEPFDQQGLNDADVRDEQRADAWAFRFAVQLCKRIGEVNPFILEIVAAIRQLPVSYEMLQREVGLITYGYPQHCDWWLHGIRAANLHAGVRGYCPVVYGGSRAPIGLAPV